MTVRLTIADRVAIWRALRKGARPRDLAAQYGVHPSYPVQLRKRGVAIGGRNPLSAGSKSAIAAEHAAGVSVELIARAYGRTRQHISRIALDNGSCSRREQASG